MTMRLEPQGGVAVRAAVPSDAPQMVCLLRDQHGELFPESQYYERSYFARLIGEKRMTAVVAETAGGRLVGMECAVPSRDFDGCLELCMKTISLDFRSRGIGKRMLIQLQSMIEHRLYTCGYAHCVTLDIISQRSLLNFGFVPAGLLIGCCLYDKGIPNLAHLELPRKHTHIVYCKPYRKRNAGVLYIPGAHAKFITGIYDAMAVLYEAGNASAPPARARIRTSQDHTQRYCAITVTRAGRDMEETVLEQLNRYASLDDQTFGAFININDPGAVYAFEILSKCGFFITGLQPLQKDSEFLLMSFVPGEVNFDEIAVLDAFAGALEYIKKERRRTERGNANG